MSNENECQITEFVTEVEAPLPAENWEDTQAREQEIRARLNRHPTRRSILTNGVNKLSAIALAAFSGAGMEVVRFVLAERTSEDNKIFQDWNKVLGIHPSAYFVVGDDFTLYPTSNEWRQKGGRVKDPRGVAIMNKILKFQEQFNNADGASRIDFDRIKKNARKLRVPECMVIIGGAINNRAARNMIGDPRKIECPMSFTDITNTWKAQLKIAQFTPPGTELRRDYDNTEKLFDFWDHQLVLPNDKKRSRYETTMGMKQQTDCYFSITKLRSPFIGDETSVIFITPLHGFGSIAVESLFEPTLSDTAKKFVTSVSEKARGIPGWQIAAMVSKFYKAEDGSMRVGAIEPCSDLIEIISAEK